VARLHVPTRLRWSDLDAYGHVNNVEILRLLEEARVQALWVADDASEREGSPTTAVIDSTLGTDTLSIVARTEIEYLKTIDYRRSALDIQLWISRLGGADFDVAYEIYSPAGVEPVELYARAMTTIALVDGTTMRPRRINPVEKSAWLPYLDDPVVFTRRR
jgi:acyl-CoA thioester hydrolase